MKIQWKKNLNDYVFFFPTQYFYGFYGYDSKNFVT